MVKQKISQAQFETVLFNSTSGTTGNITLSETSANFSYIEIFFTTNTNYCSSVKVYAPNGKLITLSTMDDNSTNSNGVLFAKMTEYLVSGTAMNTTYYGWKQITGAAATGADNTIKIVRVVGIR